MEIKYLVYIGNKQHGSITIKQVRANSPFRVLKYYSGMRLRLGVEIPEYVANFIVRSYRSLFKYQSVTLEGHAAFKDQFKLFLDSFIGTLNPQEMVFLINQVFSEAIDDLPDPKNAFEIQFGLLLASVRSDMRPDDLAPIMKRIMGEWRQELKK